MKAALLIFLAIASCATVETETTVTDPATGLVTVTKTKSTAPDQASVTALAGTAAAFAPRAVVIHSGK